MPTPFTDINIGSAPNANDGTQARTAFTTVNSNFQLIEDVLTLDDVNGRAGFKTTPSHVIHIIQDATQPATEEAIRIKRTQDDATSPVNVRDVHLETDFIATDLATPRNANQGVRSICWFGGETQATAAIGTVHAGTFGTRITGSGHSENEHAALFGTVTYHIGTGFTQATGPAGRCWLTDFNVHGPIAVQPDLLTGVTTFCNNYYNGSPVDQPAAVYVAASYPGRGGGGTSTHSAAQTFPVDIGYAVYGKSGTVASPTSTGFTVAYQAGGTGSGWNASSIIGTAFYGRDVITQGILLDNPGAGSPKGLVMSGATWGTLIDLSGVTSPPADAISLPDADLVWATDNTGSIGTSVSAGRPNSAFIGLGGLTVGNSHFIVLPESGGGRMRLLRMTAAASNVSATTGTIYFRDGTGSGLRLVVKAGSGAEVTIADDIPVS